MCRFGSGRARAWVPTHWRQTCIMILAVANDPTRRVHDRQSVGPGRIGHEFSGHGLRRLLRSMPFAAKRPHSSSVYAAGAALRTCASLALFRQRQLFLNMRGRRCVEQQRSHGSSPRHYAQGRAISAVGRVFYGV